MTRPKAKPKTAAKTKTALQVLKVDESSRICPTTYAGRHAKDLPADLLTRYAESLIDPEHLGLHPELALVDARISSLMRRLKVEAGKDSDGAETGGAGDWTAAHNAYKLLRRAMLIRDKEAQAEAHLRLESLFSKVSDSREVWAEAMLLVEKRRKLVESEARAQHRARAFISVKDMKAFTNSLMVAVRDEVADEETRQRILSKLQKLWDDHNGG